MLLVREVRVRKEPSGQVPDRAVAAEEAEVKTVQRQQEITAVLAVRLLQILGPEEAVEEAAAIQDVQEELSQQEEAG